MGLGVVLALSPSCNAMLVELHDSSKGNRCSLVAPVDLAQDAENLDSTPTFYCFTTQSYIGKGSIEALHYCKTDIKIV